MLKYFMPNLDPDLSANLIHTIYALFIHNYILFAYLLGLGISVLVALKRPNRSILLMILGFAILAFSFEYDKHIIEGLREQTLNSIITVESHFTAQRWINTIIGEVLPIFFYISGWVMIYLGIIFGNRKVKSAKES